jgi:phytoene synthase
VNVETAYATCEGITRREAKNFSYGIRLLRPRERKALSAVYALARRIDDIGDGDMEPARKLEALAGSRKALDELHLHRDDPVLVAVADVAMHYELPLPAFGDLIDGCEMDVIGVTYESFDDLVVYCRRVAGSIGRLSLSIFGTRGRDDAVMEADDLGVALQIVNILRDVKEDRERGRVYLPAGDARSAGCPPDLSGPPEAVAKLVGLECPRARDWFRRGFALLPHLDIRSRACIGAMAGIYERLLDRIESDPIVVTRTRVSLSGTEKLFVAFDALARAASSGLSSTGRSP